MVPKKVSLQLLSKQSIGDVYIAKSSANEVQRLQKFRRHNCCMFVVACKSGRQLTVESAEYCQTRGSNHLPGRQVTCADSDWQTRHGTLNLTCSLMGIDSGKKYWWKWPPAMIINNNSICKAPEGWNTSDALADRKNCSQKLSTNWCHQVKPSPSLIKVNGTTSQL